MPVGTGAKASPRRNRRLRRRFSSASTSGTWNGFPRSHRHRNPSTSPSTSQAYFSNPQSRAEGSETQDGQIHSSDHDSESRPFLTRSKSRPFIYASLPPTPISPSPPYSPKSPATPLPALPTPSEPPVPHRPLFSLWDYLREELLATDFDSHQELKWDRVSNFLSIPLAMEKVRCGLLGSH